MGRFEFGVDLFWRTSDAQCWESGNPPKEVERESQVIESKCREPRGLTRESLIRWPETFDVDSFND